MTRMSDTELVRRCLARERGAWEALVDRYADLVYGIARRAGLDTARSEDVVQDVFLVLLRNLRRLRRHDRLMGWIVKSARRAAWRTSRRERATQKREAAESRPEQDPAPGPEQSLATDEQRFLVREAMASLDVRCQRLLDALFLRGEGDYRQIGEELGMAVGSIGPTRRRCLEKLVAALEALGLSASDVAADVSTPPPSGSREKGPSGPGDAP